MRAALTENGQTATKACGFGLYQFRVEGSTGGGTLTLTHSKGGTTFCPLDTGVSITGDGVINVGPMELGTFQVTLSGATGTISVPWDITKVG